MAQQLVYRMRKVGALLAIMATTGCAYRPVAQIPADPALAADARTISAVMTEFLIHRLPPASTTLHVTATGKTNSVLPIDQQFTADLRAAGFAIAQDVQQGAVQVDYGVRPLNGGLVVIVRTPAEEGAQWFARTTEGLQPGSYIAVRQGSEQ